MFSQSPLFSTQGSRNYEVFLSDRSRNYSWTCVSFQYCSLESFQMVLSPKKKKKKCLFLTPGSVTHRAVLIGMWLAFQGTPAGIPASLYVAPPSGTLPCAVASLSFLGLSCLSPAQGDHQAPPGFPCPAAGRLTR